MQGSFVVRDSPNKTKKSAKGLMDIYNQKMLDFYLLEINTFLCRSFFLDRNSIGCPANPHLEIIAIELLVSVNIGVTVQAGLLIFYGVNIVFKP